MIPSSLSSSSSSSATVRVDKATSDLLIGPDWTMNIDICDSINTNQWDAKDVVKAVKKRLQHKNPKVQLLALTLLETMVKNCGDHVHFQIVERNILQEMIKIVKKKTDMHVRDKILVLLDSWQEAFGGPGGKYPQYYWAYEELRHAGVVFPQRSLDSAPIFTPPVARSTLRHTQAGYGMPSNSSARLDEAMGAEMENLTLSIITSMRNVLDLLADMLQAVNPSDRASVKDEVIVDLVNRCRSNQKKLMQMLSTTGDEELLGQGLELNDSLQSVLAKHDAIASGSPLPTQVTDIKLRSVAARDSSIKPTEVKEPSQTPNANPSVPAVTSVRAQIEVEEDQEDDFAQLARRHSKTHSITSQGTSTGYSGSVTSANSGNVTSVNASINAMSPTQASVAPVLSNALALADPPAPVRTTKEQDMIDLLSLTLSTVTASPQTPHTPAASSQNIHQPSLPLTLQGYPYASQAYTGNQGQVPFNSYVVPWAQPQSQLQPQPQSPSYLQPQPQLQPQSHSQPYFQPQPQPQAHLQSQPQSQTQPQSQLQPQYHSQTYFQPQPQAQLQHQPQSQSKLLLQSHSQPYFQPQPQAQLQHQPQSQSKLQPQSHSQPYFQPEPTSQDQLQPQHQSQTQTQPQLQPQAQPQHLLESQPQPQPQSHPRLQHQHESQPRPRPQPQPQHQPQYQSQQRTQAQAQYLQYSSGYPPPPWAPTPGYLSNRSHLSTTSNMFSIPQANAPASHTSMHGARPLHNVNSFATRGGNVSLMNGEQRLSSSPRATAPAAGQKPFVPSYRLFEDLNVFGNGDGKFKMSSSTSPSLSGTSSPSMVGGRK